MIFDWYKLFKLSDFLDEAIVSKEMIVVFEALGRKTVQVTRGNTVALVYDNTFLPLNFLDQNPYIDGRYASYVDVNNEVWLGIEAAA